jgi:2-dehydropantoate 2-reductase
MRVLIYGAGVIGSIYGARLAQAGHEVVVLARAERVEQLRRRGLQLEEAATGARLTLPVEATAALAPDDPYDLVLVPVRCDQLDAVLPPLAASRATPAVLFFGNNAGGSERLVTALGQERVLLGFPGAAGERQGDTVRYTLIRGQRTTLGELATRERVPRRTERLARISSALEAAGFPVALSARMEAWLTSHAVFIAPLQAALALHQGNSRSLAQDRALLRLAVRATRQGFRSLSSLGRLEVPLNLRLLYLWLPEPLAVEVWRRQLPATLGLAAPAAETAALAEQLHAALAPAARPAPALDRLFSRAGG